MSNFPEDKKKRNRLINTFKFLKTRYDPNNSPEDITELFAELFSELESLLCASLVGISPDNIESVKIAIANGLDLVREHYLQFDITQLLEDI